MLHHLVVKLRRRLPEPPAVPDWVTFVTDKSVQVTSLDAEVDRLLAAHGLRFWVTHEYAPALDGWSALEVHHGLDRTYRLVLRDRPPERLPDGLLARLAAVPAVESCHELQVAGAALPDPAPDPAAPPAPDAAPARGAPPGGAPPAGAPPTSAVPPTSRAAALAARERGPWEAIGLPFAHAVTRGRPDVRVAVLDTGVDLDHPELRGKVVDRADFVDLRGMDTSSFVGDVLGLDGDPTDELGHGTHVAGIVAGDGHGMPVGLAPGVRLLAVRVLATLRDGDTLQGAGIVDNINPAIKWAVDRGADVVNMSLGIRHTGGGLPHEDVIRYAVARGVTVVAASGNDGTGTKYYPGALPGVVAVGASDDRGEVAPFTSWGAPITVVAPGVHVLSAFAHGRYAVASGTSQAAPCVAGAVALLKSAALDRDVRLGADAVATVLRETSDRVDGRERTAHAGFGQVNLTDAFKWLLHSLN